jgi:hypothetical protein
MHGLIEDQYYEPAKQWTKQHRPRTDSPQTIQAQHCSTTGIKELKKYQSGKNREIGG